MLPRSETINLAERKAVSPDVIGAATTPKIANMPPNVPSQLLHIAFTTTAALYPFSAKYEDTFRTHSKPGTNNASSVTTTIATNPEGTDLVSLGRN